MGSKQDPDIRENTQVFTWATGDCYLNKYSKCITKCPVALLFLHRESIEFAG